MSTKTVKEFYQGGWVTVITFLLNREYKLQYLTFPDQTLALSNRKEHPQVLIYIFLGQK